MFDFRTTLKTMQCYAADWTNPRMIENFLKTMDFSHEEAAISTPRTACGVELGVAPTIRVGTSLGVANFIKFVLTKQMKTIMDIDIFNFEIDAY